jgi:hypothetical protein
MSKSKVLIIAALTLGVTSGVNAQQQPPAPPQLPQAPNMTFFVTGAGPGKALTSAASKVPTGTVSN